VTSEKNAVPHRVLVVDVPGSGKTSVARRVAEILGIPHVELDGLHWGANWTPREDFRPRAEFALSSGRWSACGNYHSKLHDLTWQRADLIVWLDLPPYTTLLRLLRRTFDRILRREELWEGNRETFRDTFFNRDSLLVWWWRTTRWDPERTQRRLVAASQATTLRLRSKSEIERWLLDLAAGAKE
jgi:adenylate kinase family enzyme